MVRIGYTLSSEEHGPQTLINNAALAEDAGFEFVGISDHFSPWVEAQGNSPFVWTVLGGISQATAEIEVFVEVTCPIMRYHPAIVAQAAATSARLLDGRFSLGVGTGEYLNEHVVGEGWPHIDIRREMLAEAVDIIRKLWSGHYIDHYGEYFTVEQGKIFTLPHHLPPIIVSGLGPKSVALAGQIGDGLVSLPPNEKLIKTFEDNGGRGKPKYAQIEVCYAESLDEARETAYKYWPNAGVPGQLTSELRVPAYFEQAAETLTPEQATKKMVLGSDPDDFHEAVQTYVDAGYDHVYFHQIGPRQEEFLRFASSQLLPAYADAGFSAPMRKDRELSFREKLDDGREREED